MEKKERRNGGRQMSQLCAASEADLEMGVAMQPYLGDGSGREERKGGGGEARNCCGSLKLKPSGNSRDRVRS